MQLYLVTKNAGKLMAAQSVFGTDDIKLLSVAKDYPEIQAETSLDIAKFTSLHVATETGIPAIREDHSLCLKALRGAPGPYINYFEKRVPVDLLLELMATQRDRSGYFEVGTVLAFPNGETRDFIFQVPLTIAMEPRGQLQNGWSRVIVLDGETRTLAEYDEKERVHIWNQNYLKIKNVIEQRLTKE